MTRESMDAVRRALARAAEVLGGTRELAYRLQVPEAELARWLAGLGSPGIGIFLRVIDILNEERRPKN